MNRFPRLGLAAAGRSGLLFGALCGSWLQSYNSRLLKPFQPTAAGLSAKQEAVSKRWASALRESATQRVSHRGPSGFVAPPWAVPSGGCSVGWAGRRQRWLLAPSLLSRSMSCCQWHPFVLAPPTVFSRISNRAPEGEALL